MQYVPGQCKLCLFSQFKLKTKFLQFLVNEENNLKHIEYQNQIFSKFKAFVIFFKNTKFKVIVVPFLQSSTWSILMGIRVQICSFLISSKDLIQYCNLLGILEL